MKISFFLKCSFGRNGEMCVCWKELCFYPAVNINIVPQIISGSRWKRWDGSSTYREVEQFIVSTLCRTMFGISGT